MQVSTSLLWDVNQTIVMDVREVMVGDYNTARVDIGDLLAFDVEEGGPTGKGAYTHELAEQYIKAHENYKNVDETKWHDSDDPNLRNFEKAHKAAILPEDLASQSTRLGNRQCKNKDGSLTTVTYRINKTTGALIVDKTTSPPPQSQKQGKQHLGTK